MFSSYHCRCGCGENVAKSGDFIAGHDDWEISQAFRKFKTKRIAQNNAAKKSTRKLTPHFGRGTVAGEFKAEPTPVKAGYFGRNK